MSKIINEKMLDLADGNPGAASVIAQFFDIPGNQEVFFEWFLKNNIKEPTLWVLYKDMCRQDIATLLLWIDEQIKNPLPKYEIQQYNGVCSVCEKKTHITAIVPEFDDYHCFKCHRSMWRDEEVSDET